jgi:hypothetical protein
VIVHSIFSNQDFHFRAEDVHLISSLLNRNRKSIEKEQGGLLDNVKHEQRRRQDVQVSLLQVLARMCRSEAVSILVLQEGGCGATLAGNLQPSSCFCLQSG